MTGADEAERLNFACFCITLTVAISVLGSWRCGCRDSGECANGAAIVAYLSVIGAKWRFDRCGDRHLGHCQRMVQSCAALEAGAAACQPMQLDQAKGGLVDA